MESKGLQNLSVWIETDRKGQGWFVNSSLFRKTSRMLTTRTTLVRCHVIPPIGCILGLFRGGVGVEKWSLNMTPPTPCCWEAYHWRACRVMSRTPNLKVRLFSKLHMSLFGQCYCTEIRAMFKMHIEWRGSIMGLATVLVNDPCPSFSHTRNFDRSSYGNLPGRLEKRGMVFSGSSCRQACPWGYKHPKVGPVYIYISGPKVGNIHILSHQRRSCALGP